jgi:AcrR family transcriptional regulator
MNDVQASQDQVRRAGRPRSEHADRAIIEAALDVFAESGAEGLCIEKVAAKAGVGKATIYRRWPGKEDLLLDALAALKLPLPDPKGESVRDDLVLLLDAIRSEAVDPRQVRQFALLLGEGDRYPRLLDRYVEAVVEPRRDVFRAVLRRGMATGELREETNIELAVDLLTGAVVARARLGHERAERGYARRLVDELLTGLASR